MDIYTNSNAQWIGWFPWGDEHAVDKFGKYLGSIYPDKTILSKQLFSTSRLSWLSRLSRLSRISPGIPVTQDIHHYHMEQKTFRQNNLTIFHNVNTQNKI